MTVNELGNNEDYVAYWALDEGSGSATADGSGNGFNGELIGDVSWIAGKLGSAVDFATANDKIVVNDYTHPASDGLSMSFWSNADHTGWSWYTPVELPGGAAKVRIQGPRVRYELTLDGTTHVLYGPRDLVSNTWEHVVCTYDGTEMRVYIGNDYTTLAVTGSISQVTGDVVLKGAYNGGSLDDVRIYDRALTGEEVGTLSSQ